MKIPKDWYAVIHGTKPYTFYLEDAQENAKWYINCDVPAETKEIAIQNLKQFAAQHNFNLVDISLPPDTERYTKLLNKQLALSKERACERAHKQILAGDKHIFACRDNNIWPDTYYRWRDSKNLPRQRNQRKKTNATNYES